MIQIFFLFQVTKALKETGYLPDINGGLGSGAAEAGSRTETPSPDCGGSEASSSCSVSAVSPEPGPSPAPEAGPKDDLATAEAAYVAVMGPLQYDTIEFASKLIDMSMCQQS